MAEIIRLENRKRQNVDRNYGIIKKLVDGKIVDCVDLDALPPEQLSDYLLIDDIAITS